MSVLTQYTKSQLSANLVSDSSKNRDRYANNIGTPGSSLTEQVTSPTQPSTLTVPKSVTPYIDDVFQQKLR